MIEPPAISLYWDNTHETFPLVENGSENPHQSQGYFNALDTFHAHLWAAVTGGIAIGDRPAFDFLDQMGFKRPVESAYVDRESLIEHLRAEHQDERVLLEPAVWSREAEDALEFLRRHGIRAESNLQGRSGRVLSLNTRLGSRNFLTNLPAVSKYVSASFVCYGEAQLHHEFERLGHLALVAKPNFSMGGIGFRTEADEDIQLATEKLLSEKQHVWRSHGQPTLVEQFIGDLETNISVTVDVRIHTGQVSIVGISRQLLSNRFCYSGIREIGEQVPDAAVQTIEDVSTEVSEALRSFGIVGYCNFDFCVTVDGRIIVCDLNVRRSAPLGVHLLLSSFDWGPPSRYFCALKPLKSVLTPLEILEKLRSKKALFDKQIGLVPLGDIVKRDGRSFVWLLGINVDYDESMALVEGLLA